MMGTRAKISSYWMLSKAEETGGDAEHQAEKADPVDDERLDRNTQAEGLVYQKPIKR